MSPIDTYTTPPAESAEPSAVWVRGLDDRFDEATAPALIGSLLANGVLTEADVEVLLAQQWPSGEVDAGVERDIDQTHSLAD